MSSIIVSLILIGILVIVHEFGHFIVAKKSGILVEEFAIGMGPKLISKQIGETLYTIRAFPLGGFCRMQGFDGDDLAGPRSFFSKSVGVRFLVMAAGSFMNFVLALVLILGLTATSFMAIPIIREISPNTAAAVSGLEVGDEILSINGKKIQIYDQLQGEILQSGGTPMEFEVLREDKRYTYVIEPIFDEERNGYLVGISPELKAGTFVEETGGFEKASLMETIHYSYYSMLNYVKVTAEGLLRVFTFTAEKEEYGGPITIIKTVGDSYDAGLTHSFGAAIQNVAHIGAVLSANLGVLNLFPIPGLDGGRILFLGIEAIRRKPMSIEVEGKINFLGFAFIMGLMVFVLYGDIIKIFT